VDKVFVEWWATQLSGYPYRRLGTVSHSTVLRAPSSGLRLSAGGHSV